MRTRSAARRSIALLATTALMTGGLATGMLASPAYAALTPEITAVSPTEWDNRSSVNITVHGTNLEPGDVIVLVPACSTDKSLPPVPAGSPCNPLSGPEVGPIEVRTSPDDYCPPDPSEFVCDADASIVGKFDLGQAAPGEYSVVVRHYQQSGTTSNPFSKRFTVFAYGGGNVSSSEWGGVGYEPIDPFFGGVDCDDIFTNDGCGRYNGLANGVPLDVHGANFAIGAKVRFLLPSGVEDTGLQFQPGNPSNPANKFGGNSNGTEGDATAGTGYPSAALIQGMYRYYDAATLDGMHAKFTPGVHTLQVVNTDGTKTGAQSTFVQPWYQDATSVSPASIGVGAQNVTVTVNGKGFRQGATVAPSCGSSAGAATPSNRQADGTYNTLTAPISISTKASAGLCTLGISNPEGAYYGLPVLNIGGAPHITAISPADTSYAHLGQGALVGCEPGDSGVGVTITGTNFVNTNPSDATTLDPAKMTRFDFGPNITVTTRGASATSASVCIDVGPDAAVGRRDVRAINPDGGSTVTGQPYICSDPVLQLDCEPDPRYDDIPLQINAGPKITSVDPTSFAQNTTDVPVHVVGTGFEDTINSDWVSITGTGMTWRAVLPASDGKSVDMRVTTAAEAVPGARTLIITNPSDYGRAVCTDCLSVDSLAVSPSTGTNSESAKTLTLAVTGAGLPALTSSSVVKLTHQTATGQPVITTSPVTVTDSTHGTTTVNLTDAALGKYNVAVVLDPANGNAAKTASCAGCFSVTGAALALDGTPPVAPTKAGQGATDWKVTFKGHGFTKGLDVSIPDVTVHDITWVSSSEFFVLTDVAPTATTGAKTGTVTGGDGVSKTFAFTVTAAPTAKSVSAGSVYGAGAGSAGSPDTTGTPAVSTLPITVTGSGFDDVDDTQVVLGSDVDVVNETVTQGSAPTCLPPPISTCTGGSDDSDTGKIAVSQNAATGKRALQLVNPADGGTATLADGFTVNPGPKVTAVANQNGQAVLSRDGQKHTVTFFGSAFPAPSTQADKDAAFKITEPNGNAIDPSAIKVENVQFATDKITADVTVAVSRGFGPVRLVVYNASDKGFSTCTTCVAVADVPGQVPSLVLTSGAKSLTATWGLPAENGSSIAGYKLTIARAGVAPTTVAVPASPRSYTFGNLVNGVTYTVTVAAVNGVGAGAPAVKTGIAGLVAALSIKLPTSVVTYGTPFYVQGKLTANGVGLGGKTIVLTFVPSVGKSYLRTVTTVASGTSKGTYSYRTSSPYTTKVKASLLANDPTYRPVSTSYLTETVRVRVLRTSPANLSKSSYTTTLKIGGNVAPNKKGKYAYLYRYVNGSKVLMQRVTISSTSTFLFAIKPGKGTYYFKVYVPATTGNAANYSTTFKLYRV